MWPLRGAGGELQAIVLTHHHRDHCAGAGPLASELALPIAAHPLTLERLSPADRGGVRLLPLAEGQRLHVDGATELEVLHTPGHAPGHVCLLDRARAVLLGGDMVPGIGTTLVAPPEGDMTLYLDSLRRLRALEPRLVLPAHGPPLADGQAAIGRLIAHRLWREHRVLVALRPEPRRLAELTREAYAELSPLRLPLAERSTLAHLAKLEREGRAARRGEASWCGVGRLAREV